MLIDNVSAVQGFRYKMKSVYAHFPININISEEGRRVEIRNFLGEKFTRVVRMPEGVKAANTGSKDEYQLDGNDIEAVSQAGTYFLSDGITQRGRLSPLLFLLSVDIVDEQCHYSLV